MDEDEAMRILARSFVDVLAAMDNRRPVVVRFTAGRQKARGRLMVVRVTGDGSGAVVLTVAAGAKAGG